MRMRDLAARGDKKLLRAGSSSSGRFRAWANRSYPEGIRLLLRISTDGRLWRSRKNGISQKKDAESRDKMSVRTGKGTTARQAA